jgi:hypothetical protein
MQTMGDKLHERQEELAIARQKALSLEKELEDSKRTHADSLQAVSIQIAQILGVIKQGREQSSDTKMDHAEQIEKLNNLTDILDDLKQRIGQQDAAMEEQKGVLSQEMTAVMCEIHNFASLQSEHSLIDKNLRAEISSIQTICEDIRARAARADAGEDLRTSKLSQLYLDTLAELERAQQAHHKANETINELQREKAAAVIVGEAAQQAQQEAHETINELRLQVESSDRLSKDAQQALLEAHDTIKELQLKVEGVEKASQAAQQAQLETNEIIDQLRRQKDSAEIESEATRQAEQEGKERANKLLRQQESIMQEGKTLQNPLSEVQAQLVENTSTFERQRAENQELRDNVGHLAQQVESAKFEVSDSRYSEGWIKQILVQIESLVPSLDAGALHKATLESQLETWYSDRSKVRQVEETLGILHKEQKPLLELKRTMGDLGGEKIDTTPMLAGQRGAQTQDQGLKDDVLVQSAEQHELRHFSDLNLRSVATKTPTAIGRRVVLQGPSTTDGRPPPSIQEEQQIRRNARPVRSIIKAVRHAPSIEEPDTVDSSRATGFKSRQASSLASRSTYNRPVMGNTEARETRSTNRVQILAQHATKAGYDDLKGRQATQQRDAKRAASTNQSRIGALEHPAKKSRSTSVSPQETKVILDAVPEESNPRAHTGLAQD